MRVQLIWDEPFENMVLWKFQGVFGMINYLPFMNDSISRAMVEPETRYDVLLDMGAAIPLPNSRFRYLAQAIIAAPPNLKLVVCASTNPLTRIVINATLGREPMLKERFILVTSYQAARDVITASRSRDEPGH